MQLEGKTIVKGSENGFNPHPSRGTGATNRFFSDFRATLVSILTRPEGRVQLPTGRDNPLITPFQSSPVPRDGCNLKSGQARARPAEFQSSPVPRDGCNGWRLPTFSSAKMFQSSPVPRDGCNQHNQHRAASVAGFNPHPSRGTGATGRSGWLIRCDRGSFNPHPSRGTGATYTPIYNDEGSQKFQSSPVPRDGCNRLAGRTLIGILQVSILTRPEGRVQHSTAFSQIFA